MATPIIRVKNLKKTFTYHKKPEGLRGSLKALFVRKKLKKEAVKNISFNINRGEFVGFVGPNGAGKTTTLKMFSGILYPTNGSVSIAGHNPSKREEEFKKKISIVMGQKSFLWISLPAIETYNLIQKMYEIPETVYRKRLKELAELMEVSDLLQVQARKLSLGQRMKCELIASLLHNPRILFLDEPTIGLDIVAQKKIREFLKEYNEKNETTIILTSHYMDDVQDLCKRLIIINEGEIGYDGSVDKIIAEYSKVKTIKLVFDKKVLKKDLQKLGKLKNCSSYEAELSVPIKDSKKVIYALVTRYPVKDINIKDVTLEEVVADIFSNNKR